MLIKKRIQYVATTEGDKFSIMFVRSQWLKVVKVAAAETLACR